jgi:hypothetical protein
MLLLEIEAVSRGGHVDEADDAESGIPGNAEFKEKPLTD